MPFCYRWVTSGSLAWGGLKEVGGSLAWKDREDRLDPEACRGNRVPLACLVSRALRWVEGSPCGFSVETLSHSTRGWGSLARPDISSWAVWARGPVVNPATWFPAKSVCQFTINHVLLVVLCLNCLFSLLPQGRAPTDQHIKQVCMRVMQGKQRSGLMFSGCFKGGRLWMMLMAILF